MENDKSIATSSEDKTENVGELVVTAGKEETTVGHDASTQGTIKLETDETNTKVESNRNDVLTDLVNVEDAKTDVLTDIFSRKTPPPPTTIERTVISITEETEEASKNEIFSCLTPPPPTSIANDPIEIVDDEKPEPSKDKDEEAAKSKNEIFLCPTPPPPASIANVPIEIADDEKEEPSQDKDEPPSSSLDNESPANATLPPSDNNFSCPTPPPPSSFTNIPIEIPDEDNSNSAKQMAKAEATEEPNEDDEVKAATEIVEDVPNIDVPQSECKEETQRIEEKTDKVEKVLENVSSSSKCMEITESIEILDDEDDQDKVSPEEKPPRSTLDTVCSSKISDQKEPEISKTSSIEVETTEVTNKKTEIDEKESTESQRVTSPVPLNKPEESSPIEILDDDDEMPVAPKLEETVKEESTQEQSKLANDDKDVESAIEAPTIDSTSVPKITQLKPLKDLLDMVDNLIPIKDDDSMNDEDALVIDEGKPVDVSVDVILKGNCMNSHCLATSDIFLAPMFVCNFFVNNVKAHKRYLVCQNCYDVAVEKYEDYCGAMMNDKALLQMEMPVREEIVELSDDSDDEGESPKNNEPKATSDVLKLLEEELEDVITEQLSKANVTQQIDWTKQLLEKKLDNNEKMCNEILADLRDMERKAYQMGKKLHAVNEAQRVSLPALDITSTCNGRQYKERYELPAFGLMARPPLEIGTVFYGVKTRLLVAWTLCKVLDIVETPDRPCQFKIGFLEPKQLARVVPGKFLAYSHPPPVRLRVGDRVIALFNSAQDNNVAPETSQKNQYFPGIIAEPLQMYNNFRYLVFFDDGYAQYVQHQDVRLVYEASPSVWDDVHPHCKDFIHEYLINYRKERPLVQVKRGHRMITEYKGNWHQAKVVEADASLVRVYFEALRRLEWIYRGSTRLGPLYREKLAAHKKNSSAPKRNEPSVEYIMIQEDDEHSRMLKLTSSSVPSNSNQSRAVARKSSATPLRPSGPIPPTPSQPAQKIQNLNNSTIILDDDIGKGRVVYYTARKNYALPRFKSHTCDPNCLFKQNNNLSMYSPIAKPLLCGWERQVVKNKAKKIIFYKAPCGRRLRNIIELHEYLRKTNCILGIECFDYDVNLHALSEYIVEKAIFQIPDISDGKEGVPVPCVNYFDDSRPPPLEYSAVRIPTEGVNLNLDEEFLCGCDCEDDCLDKLKCACQMLTIGGAKYGNPNLPKEQVGYQYKRLFEQVRTGIYECNPRCKCSKTCLNRVVQMPLSNKLQLFKTNNRGWGLRATCDIPRGTFICVYAGYLLTEQKANEYGGDHGDEYFADLDYIEIAEETKAGYESDAPEMSDESDDYDPEDDRTHDDDYVAFTSGQRRVTRQNSRSSGNDKGDKKKKDKSKRPMSATPSSDGEGDRERINLLPDQMGNAEDMPAVEDSEDKSLRRFYGKDESVYVMDAKITGNIGRYFNHSCEPNMFVQNVFVDTHDLRFPWIAFFAICYIRSGTELTWNYSYDVGSVPGKVLYCQCGAPNCRQRLL